MSDLNVKLMLTNGSVWKIGTLSIEKDYVYSGNLKVSYPNVKKKMHKSKTYSFSCEFYLFSVDCVREV